jgi:hypothetical protein
MVRAAAGGAGHQRQDVVRGLAPPGTSLASPTCKTAEPCFVFLLKDKYVHHDFFHETNALYVILPEAAGVFPLFCCFQWKFPTLILWGCTYIGFLNLDWAV